MVENVMNELIVMTKLLSVFISDWKYNKDIIN